MNNNTAVNNKKRKRKGTGPRFNVFDFLIILSIIVCVGAIVARAIFIGTAKNEIKTAKIVFEVSGISMETAELLCKENQPIYLQDGDLKIGKILEASYTEQKVWEKDENGNLQSARHPEKKEARGTAEMIGTWGEDGFFVGGTNLATVGKAFDIYTPYVSCTITIISISEN